MNLSTNFSEEPFSEGPIFFDFLLEPDVE